MRLFVVKTNRSGFRNNFTGMRDFAAPPCNDFTGMRDFIAGDWLKIFHSRKIVAFFCRKSFTTEKSLQEEIGNHSQPTLLLL